MATTLRDFIPNQVFVGLPWKNVRKRYEHAIEKLERKYPLHFTIVGRNDGQDAEDLFEIIKQRIESSSYGVFDATGGNANVSLEYGYAEGLEVPRSRPSERLTAKPRCDARISCNICKRRGTPNPRLMKCLENFIQPI